MFPVNQELMRKVVAGAVEKLGPWCCNTQPRRLQARGVVRRLLYAPPSKVRAFGHSFHPLPEACLCWTQDPERTQTAALPGARAAPEHSELRSRQPATPLPP